MTIQGSPVAPEQMAALLASTVADLVLGLDVDGVLAPIVAHADQARLLPGVGEVLERLGMTLPVAVVSGRSLDDLERQFAFPTTVEVVGSHGLEWRSGPAVTLDDGQRALLAVVTALADEAVALAGDGAWREAKPSSVVVHVRQADPIRAHAAVDALHRRLVGSNVWVKNGHAVVELMVVDTSKATAMHTFRCHHGKAHLAFVGDDLTDEEVFRAATPGDITVRVGDGVTAAAHRLAGPAAVLTMLARLADALT